jgi:hypothetical protein
MHRALETLRSAINWGMAQTPPLFNNSPFHRFGVRMHKKAELELCCRRGEMLLIQNKRVNWDMCQIGIPGATAGHASIQQAQLYLNVTDEELRRSLEVSWGRPLRAVSGG